MNLLELRSFVRERLDDEVTPYQWSDTFINAAINRAEREAAERALLLKDYSQIIAVTAGNTDYDIPLSTIVIDRLSIGNNVLVKTNEVELDSIFSDWESLTNEPKFYIQDGYKVRLVGIPDADYTIKLSITRRPLSKLIDDADTPEIDEEYHEFLMFQVLYEAYSRRDEDLYDPNAAQMNMLEFTNIFGQKRSAKFMSAVKRHRTGSRVYPRRFV